MQEEGLADVNIWALHAASCELLLLPSPALCPPVPFPGRGMELDGLKVLYHPNHSVILQFTLPGRADKARQRGGTKRYEPKAMTGGSLDTLPSSLGTRLGPHRAAIRHFLKCLAGLELCCSTLCRLSSSSHPFLSDRSPSASSSLLSCGGGLLIRHLSSPVTSCINMGV